MLFPVFAELLYFDTVMGAYVESNMQIPSF